MLSARPIFGPGIVLKMECCAGVEIGRKVRETVLVQRTPSFYFGLSILLHTKYGTSTIPVYQVRFFKVCKVNIYYNPG